MTMIHRQPDAGAVAYTKGSPEAAFEVCSSVRVDGRTLPIRPVALQADRDLEPLGLERMEDPVHPEVREAVDRCMSAGIRVVMVTGEYPATTVSVAASVGLPSRDLLVGAQLPQDETGARRMPHRSGDQRAGEDRARAEARGRSGAPAQGECRRPCPATA
jgi:magnesium-transporting ATPase (P-type)